MSPSSVEIRTCIREVINKVAAWPLEGADQLHSDYVLFRFVDLKLLLKTINFIFEVQTQKQGQKLRVLDVGTSLGIIPLTLTRLGVETFACDHPREQRIRGLFEAEGIPYLTFDLINGDLPYPADFFDIVVFKDVIEHLPFSSKRTLTSFRQILRPDGFLFLDTPNLARLSSRIRLLLGRSVHPPLELFFSSEFPFPGHYREYTAHELQQMLHWSGFKVLRTEYTQQSDILLLFRQKKYFRHNRFQQISWGQIIALAAWKPLASLIPPLSQMIIIIAQKRRKEGSLTSAAWDMDAAGQGKTDDAHNLAKSEAAVIER